MTFRWYFLPLFCFLSVLKPSVGNIYPRPTVTRDVFPLNGLWDFALSDSTNSTRSYLEKWHEKNLRDVPDLEVQRMAVPSSYNDIGTSTKLRDHVGPVWYQRRFFVPRAWNAKIVWIRFSSVSYSAEVWINGNSAVNHSIGHLPFRADVSKLVKYGSENTITVKVDNTLTSTTVPQGRTETLNSGRIRQTYDFDFFNYAGIDGTVHLYTTPQTYVDNITVTIQISGTTGVITYQTDVVATGPYEANITLYDREGNAVRSSIAPNAVMSVPNAKFWWPNLMDPEPGYLYTLDYNLIYYDDTILDNIVVKIGIRTVGWDGNNLRINNRPIYLRGFGRHEDSDFRGGGLDLPVIVRDYNLMLWSGANAYRSSYYPYAEEILDLADELGIVVIDECPAVALSEFSDELLETHKRSITEMIHRDISRPSVILWSAGSGSVQNNNDSYNYFKEVTDHIRSRDDSRPVTIVFTSAVDNAAELVDIASINIDKGWNDDTGDLDVVPQDVLQIIRNWREAYNIPIIVSGYGADSEEGLHNLPIYVWSEEYQAALLEDYFQMFDIAQVGDGLVGEFVSNLADFKTSQNFLKLGGDKKGVFSRNRQPKLAAFTIRERYWNLAQTLDSAEVPRDLKKHRLNKFNDTKV